MSPAKDHPASDTLSPCTHPPALPCHGELVLRGDGLLLASPHVYAFLPKPQEQGKCLPWGPSDDSLPGLAAVLPGSRESPLLSDHRPHAFKPSPFPPRPPCHGMASTLLLCHPSWPRQSLLRRPGLQGSGAGLVGDGGTWRGQMWGFVPGAGREAPSLILSP